MTSENNSAGSPAFKQTERFIGTVVEISRASGVDIFTLNARGIGLVAVTVPNVLKQQLAPHTKDLMLAEKQVRFTGVANYKAKSNYSFELLSFIATSFDIFEKTTTADEWISGFVGCGDSGWQNKEDPIEIKKQVLGTLALRR